MGRTKKIINGTMAKISQKTIDYNTMYSFTNIKDGSLTGTEMTALLTPAYEGFIAKDSVYYCCESGGAYSEGHFYQFTITGTSPLDNVASWTDLGTLGGGSESTRQIVTLVGTSGILSQANFDLLNNHSKNVEIRIGNRLFKYTEEGVNYSTFTSVIYPTTNTQSIQELHIQQDPLAANYRHWNIEDVAISNVIQSITIDQPSSATSGTLPAESLTILQANDLNFINFANEIYKLNDKQTTLGWLVYTHTGQDTQGQFFVKCITITLSTGAWVLSTTGIVKAPATHTGAVTKAGLYAVTVSNTVEWYTIMLSIDNLTRNVSAYGGYYNQNTDACLVYYSSTTNLINVQDPEELFTIVNITLVAEY